MHDIKEATPELPPWDNIDLQKQCWCSIWWIKPLQGLWNDCDCDDYLRPLEYMIMMIYCDYDDHHDCKVTMIIL